MTGIAIFTVLIAAGAPVPVAPRVQGAVNVDREQAETFARMVSQLALKVMDKSAKEGVTEKDLFAGAIQDLYTEVGLSVPDSNKTEILRATSSVALIELLTSIRMKLGNHPSLAGSRSLFTAMNGFKHATDPLSMLVSPRLNAYASVEQDFGIGIELEGVSGLRWTIYQTEYGIASGHIAPLGFFGPVPKPEAVPCPAVLPWRVSRVVPGSPAQKGGVKPGDRITHVDGVEINAENFNNLFGTFALPPRFALVDPLTGRPVAPDRTIVFQRDNGKPFEVNLKTNTYNPESAFGVIRLNEDKWDCMLDRQAKIGYIRIGPIETGLDTTISEMVANLVKQGCRGLILDLRWCPGGYVDPGTRIAGMFLKDGSVIAKMEYRNSQTGVSGNLYTPPESGKYVDMPLVVLVGQETTGGGELIASALRDNDRCVIVGQRTVGRASIQNTIDAGFAGVQFKLTTGISLRPNGKNRHRKTDSRPTDDWGVRPDDGLEVPITLDKSFELHRAADLQALRLASSNEALPFDDPNQDPYRLAALIYFRKRFAAGK
jgi:carboxyl-terminal processing protease